MKTQKFFGFVLMLGLVLFVALEKSQAQAQNPKAWFEYGDQLWWSGNSSGALPYYDKAQSLAWQKQDWFYLLSVSQRYLGLGQGYKARDAYSLAANCAWNWAIDKNTIGNGKVMQLRPNREQVAYGIRGLQEAINYWQNTLSKMQMGSDVYQAIKFQADSAATSLQLVLRLQNNAPNPQPQPQPPSASGLQGTWRYTASCSAPDYHRGSWNGVMDFTLGAGGTYGGKANGQWVNTNSASLGDGKLQGNEVTFSFVPTGWTSHYIWKGRFVSTGRIEGTASHYNNTCNFVMTR